MKKTDFKNKSLEELRDTVSQLRSKLFNLNFQSPDQKVKDVSQAGKIRKDIARALTSIQEKMDVK